MIHIVQDDCASDGFEYFEKEVLKQIGFQFSIIIGAMELKEDLGDTLIYHWGAYEIRNEAGMGYSIKSIFTEVSAVPKPTPEITLKVTLENGRWLVNDKTTDNLSSLELRFLNMFFAEMKHLHHE
jgi:hypothetical protein